MLACTALWRCHTATQQPRPSKHPTLLLGQNPAKCTAAAHLSTLMLSSLLAAMSV